MNKTNDFSNSSLIDKIPHIVYGYFEKVKSRNILIIGLKADNFSPGSSDTIWLNFLTVNNRGKTRGQILNVNLNFFEVKFSLPTSANNIFYNLIIYNRNMTKKFSINFRNRFYYKIWIDDKFYLNPEYSTAYISNKICSIIGCTNRIYILANSENKKVNLVGLSNFFEMNRICVKLVSIDNNTKTDLGITAKISCDPENILSQSQCAYKLNIPDELDERLDKKITHEYYEIINSVNSEFSDSSTTCTETTPGLKSEIIPEINSGIKICDETNFSTCDPTINPKKVLFI